MTWEAKRFVKKARLKWIRYLVTTIPFKINETILIVLCEKETALFLLMICIVYD